MVVQTATLPRQTSESTNISEQDADQTSDDRLATNLFKDYSSQNQVFIQIFIALSGAGVGYGVDVRDAYAFFAKEKINVEKLIKNPEYREQVKKYAGHVNFWEKGAIEKGTSKLGAVMDGTNRAIREVDVTCENLVILKEGLIKDYSTELQNLYGLEKKEIDAIMQRAKYAVRADPNISMQDFVQRQAQEIARRNIELEVKRDLKAKNEILTPIQENRAIEVKTAQKKLDYIERTKSTHLIEEVNHSTIIRNYKEQLNKILTAPPPATIPPKPPPPPPTISSKAFPNIKLSLPSFSLPHFSFPNISLPSGLTQGLGGGLKSMSGLLSKGLSGLANMAKSALPKLASLAAPPVAAAIAALTAIDVLTGGLGSKLIGAIIIIAVGAPIIMMLFLTSNTFSSNTASNPTILRVSVKNDKTYVWYEFNKQYLSIESSDTQNLIWSRFEKNYLSPLNLYLSLENSK